MKEGRPGAPALGRGLDRRDRPREAEALLRDVQRALLKKQMGYDAALISLDLATLYAQEGQRAELKRLAAEVMPAFESREVHREALAALALLMFQQACEEERLTVQLAPPARRLPEARASRLGGLKRLGKTSPKSGKASLKLGSPSPK